MAIEEEETAAKLREYQEFLARTLRPKLGEACYRLEEIEQKIGEYNDLRNRILELESSKEPRLDTQQVDLGHTKVFCKAEIDDCSTLFVHVGIGFHVELSISEAVAAIDKRVLFLQDVEKNRAKEKNEIQQHVDEAQTILGQLSLELEVMRS